MLLTSFRGVVRCCWQRFGESSGVVGSVSGSRPVLLAAFRGVVRCCWQRFGESSGVVGSVSGSRPVLLAAFRGVVRWQNRIWTLVGAFHETRLRSDVPRDLSADELKRYEDQLFDSRNYFLKEVSNIS